MPGETKTEAGDPCSHHQVSDGRCALCGACTHEVVLNGACYFCGATDLAVTVRPVAAPAAPPVIPADRLRRRR